MGWQTVLKLLSFLKAALQWTKKGVFMRIWAATSRDRAFWVAAAYYIVYENWGALTAFDAGVVAWFKSVVFAVGGALVRADTVIEENVRALAMGSVEPVRHTVDIGMFQYEFVSPELAAVGAVVAILGALSTILIYFRAAKAAWQAKNPNIGLDEAVLVPAVVYALAVLAVSAVQGSPRVPFQGVYVLVQNLDVVSAVLQPLDGNASVTGELSSLPFELGELGNQSSH